MSSSERDLRQGSIAMAENVPDLGFRVQRIINSNIHALANLSPSGGWEMYHFPVEKFVSHKEKQISVDPSSLKPVDLIAPVSSHDGKHKLQSKGSGCGSSKFLSFSLPNSGSSSPLTAVLKQQKKKAKHKNDQLNGPFSRQHSVALTNLERLRQSHLRRSKSCGEGRACPPSMDFDLLTRSASKINHAGQEIDERRAVDMEDHGVVPPEKAKLVPNQEDKFKCGALCLFLPGFNKAAKPVRARKDPFDQMGIGHVVSQRVSLEKFECGSWRSSALIEDAESSSNLFFDLPMELIRCSNVNDAESPVSTAFVFDSNTTTGRKGVLKTNPSGPCASSKLVSSESSSNLLRHVQFSDASPTLHPSSPSSCITPRLRQARDDFNAFLEAQSA